MDQFRCDPCFSVKFFILFLTSFMGKHWGQLNPPRLAKGASRPEAALQTLAWWWCFLGSHQVSAES